MVTKPVRYERAVIRAMLTMGNMRSLMRQGLQGLPVSIDDAERDFGLNIYDRMLNDAAVDGCIDTIKTMVLADGYRVLPSHRAPTRYAELSGGGLEGESDYNRAKEIQEWMQGQLDNVKPDFGNVLSNLMDSLVWGHKIAEIILEPRDGQLQLAQLMPRPKQMYAFAADDYMRVEGIYPLPRGGSAPNVVDASKIVPLQKFVIMTVGGRDGDPRGRSQLRSAYTGWMIKQGLWLGYNRYLEKFATPSVIVNLPPEAAQAENTETATVDDDDLAEATPEEAYMAKLLEFANGVGMVLDNEASAQVIESRSNGEAYGLAFDLCDRQIATAIINTTRQTLEARHGSRADSDSAEDTVVRIGRLSRRELSSIIREQLFKPLVAINFGPDDAEKYCPNLSLGAQPEPSDNIALMDAMAKWRQAGLLHDSQIEEVCGMVGMPIPDIEAMLTEKAEQREAELRSQRLIGALDDDDA